MAELEFENKRLLLMLQDDIQPLKLNDIKVGMWIFYPNFGYVKVLEIDDKKLIYKKMEDLKISIIFEEGRIFRFEI